MFLILFDLLSQAICRGDVYPLVLQTCKILAAERLRLIKFCTRLIADYFQHVVNVLRCWFSTKWWNSETRNMKQFPKVSGIKCISKTTCYSKSTSINSSRLSFTNSCMLTDSPDRHSLLLFINQPIQLKIRSACVLIAGTQRYVNHDFFSLPSEYD